MNIQARRDRNRDIHPRRNGKVIRPPAPEHILRGPSVSEHVRDDLVVDFPVAVAAEVVCGHCHFDGVVRGRGGVGEAGYEVGCCWRGGGRALVRYAGE